jgi:hypothetical protein
MEPGPTSEKPSIADVLTTPVREAGEDAWTRFEGASAAIGHYIRLVHDGRLSPNDGWEAICQYNAAMLRPAWSLERLKLEADRLWRRHVERNGPALLRNETPPVATIPAFTLGALLDDTSPMPDDVIAPRVLTPGGMLVLGGAPKVGKSDLLICLLVHMAAGVAFLGFTPPRPLRIFYLQAEIQYHYLRERLQAIQIEPESSRTGGFWMTATRADMALSHSQRELACRRACKLRGITPHQGQDSITRHAGRGRCNAVGEEKRGTMSPWDDVMAVTNCLKCGLRAKSS